MQARLICCETRLPGLLALTTDDVQRALSRADRVLPVERLGTGGVASVTTEPLLDAEGIGAATGTAASWWLAAANRDDVPHYRIGRFVRFRLSEILEAAPKIGKRRQVGREHKAAAAVPILQPSRKQRMNGKAVQ